MPNESVVSINIANKKASMPAGDPPPWLPNWKDESAYPDASYPLRLWAWEFLRRNLEYQADYRRFASVPSTVLADDGVSVWSPKWAATTFSLDEDTRFFHCDPPALPGETVSEYEQRHSGKEFILENLEAHLRHKWGVSTLNDPAGGDVSMGGYGEDAELPPHFLEFESESDVPLNDPLRFEGGGGGRRVTLRCGSDPITNHLSHFFARFDARYPLDRQIEEVRSLYESRRRFLEEEGLPLVSPVGPQLRKLQEYLRIFDAKWHGATHREIARKMYPELLFEEKGSVAKRVDYALGKARDLVRRGYRDLLIWADP